MASGLVISYVGQETIGIKGKERLVVYMRKLNTEVNNVYKTVNEGKFGNE